MVMHGGGASAAGYGTSAGGGVRLQHGSLLGVCPAGSSPVGVAGCYMGTSRECACVRVCVGRHTMCVGLLYAAGMCAGVE